MSIFNNVYTPMWYYSPWIYHNSTDGLISMSSDGGTRYTIADKNLWATTVWNSWDGLSQNNCWTYYQWGNNYWFPFTWALGQQSTTQVNAQNYWPWNYYSSSTFISRGSRPFYWDTSNNLNLRWWTTWTNAARQWPCASGYHIPTDSERTTLRSVIYNIIWSRSWTNLSTNLKLPLAWQLTYYRPAPFEQWSVWYYWTCLAISTGGDKAYNFRVDSSNSWMNYNNYRTNGFSIRPFSNEAVVPDSSRTKLN